ncbi:hypothetical protein JTB14_020563 [Gonioctena quinquepunctata]|nr:hypothetical protein JTB14_020563 [Gonioctena quinquepunctata]
MDQPPVNDENNCDINPGLSPEDVDEDSCQFLKCTPKENPPPSYHDPLITSEDIPKHVSLRRNPNNIDPHTTHIHSNGDQDCCGNKIFAKQNEDGTWLLRWDVEKQSEEDFLALCYEGEFL